MRETGHSKNLCTGCPKRAATFSKVLSFFIQKCGCVSCDTRWHFRFPCLAMRNQLQEISSLYTTNCLYKVKKNKLPFSTFHQKVLEIWFVDLKSMKKHNLKKAITRYNNIFSFKILKLRGPKLTLQESLKFCLRLQKNKIFTQFKSGVGFQGDFD